MYTDPDAITRWIETENPKLAGNLLLFVETRTEYGWGRKETECSGLSCKIGLCDSGGTIISKKEIFVAANFEEMKKLFEKWLFAHNSKICQHIENHFEYFIVP